MLTTGQSTRRSAKNRANELNAGFSFAFPVLLSLNKQKEFKYKIEGELLYQLHKDVSLSSSLSLSLSLSSSLSPSLSPPLSVFFCFCLFFFYRHSFFCVYFFLFLFCLFCCYLYLSMGGVGVIIL